jgi:hypothetical protein
MRPSRIIVGEVRAAECLDLLMALNSGLQGMCTLHANSAREALVKMCTLPLLAGEKLGRLSVFRTAQGCPQLPVFPFREQGGLGAAFATCGWQAIRSSGCGERRAGPPAVQAARCRAGSAVEPAVIARCAADPDILPRFGVGAGLVAR